MLLLIQGCECEFKISLLDLRCGKIFFSFAELLKNVGNVFWK